MREEIRKSSEEWKRELTPEQFRVTREKGTEQAFSGAYHDCHDPGLYLCVCCGAPLFDSEAKFDSGTGWPSFRRPAVPENIASEEDRSFGMRRTEIHCARCGSHLGHVFDDGPAPEGMRFCVNSLSLKLEKRKD